MSSTALLSNLAARRILVLDGAMGTMIQTLGLGEAAFRGTQFAAHPKDLRGCNDLLALTRPEAIERIHVAYLEAGADILSTNTFNSTRIAMADYALEAEVRRINAAAVACARRAIDAHQAASQHSGRAVEPKFIAGVIGPTNRTASLSPDVNDPGFRAVTFDDLAAAYDEQADALIEAGVDLLLVETVFDTLNLKACLFALERCFARRGVQLPVMVSVTIVDRSGRTLSGQTLEGFYTSITHADLFSVGINCALGPDLMRPYVEELSSLSSTRTSCHPNAGLPNELGGYDETPERMAQLLGEFAEAGWLNIVGGCCGTTPEHILAIADRVRTIPPRNPPQVAPLTRFSGLEPAALRPGAGLFMIGERTNVAGSRAFARLLRENRLEEAVTVARQQVEGGANAIDVNLDDGLLDADALMPRFLNLLAADPDVARVPVMVDSSRWSVLEAGLKCLQGKSIVNSISLKEGEEEFLRQARLVRQYGAACVVMMFDEQGQAVTVEHKVAIAERAYRLLTEKAGFAPCDVIFDLNILTVGTGIAEHNRYAVNFFEAAKVVKQRLPEVRLSGGVSNVSFAFRGNEPIRRAMHAAFLYHAIRAGLDMAIVNAGQLDVYEDIPEQLREQVEDVLLDRREDATERLTAVAQTLGASAAPEAAADAAWRRDPIDQRLHHAMVHGIVEFLEPDLDEATGRYATALAILEGPLMAGMKTVGDLFGDGKMFLPQVVRSARVMKKAVAYLQPLLERQSRALGRESIGAAPADAAGPTKPTPRGRILLATVKGDVHDIGKNIVGIVLACNNYEVTDLGVMTPCERILDAALEQQFDIVGLSGLITPSLDEMVHVAKEMQRRGMTQPLLIGGATTSDKHTAVKIAPGYAQSVVYVPDASRAAGVVGKLLSPEARPGFDAENRRLQAELVASFQKRSEVRLVPYAEAVARRFATDWSNVRIDRPAYIGTRVFDDYPLAEPAEWIDWSPFFWAWELRGKYPAIFEHPEQGEQARRLFDDAQAVLGEATEKRLLRGKAVCGFWPAVSEGDDVLVFSDETLAHEIARFSMLRQQWERRGQKHFLSLADFVAPRTSGRCDYVGAFAVTAGHGAAEWAARCEADHDDYKAILVKALADRLAEAMAEHLHHRVRIDWGYGREESLSLDDVIAEKYRGIRPAPGYPACPDHTEKDTIFRLLDATTATGIRLTESYAMSPAAAVCGWYFAHPESKYFAVDRITRDQVEAYAHRKGMSVGAVERWLAPNLGYDPA